MVFEKSITINFADGNTLEYISTERYTNGYVLYKDLKHFIRQETGNSHFDLYDDEGINQSDFEMVYSLVFTCIFKISKCVNCKFDEENLDEDGLCFTCWRAKDELTEVEISMNSKKRYIFVKNYPNITSFKVYFNQDNTQDRFKGCDDDGETVQYYDSTDRLMYEGNRVKVLSEIPDEFIHYYREVEYDTVLD